MEKTAKKVTGRVRFGSVMFICIEQLDIYDMRLFFYVIMPLC